MRIRPQGWSTFQHYRDRRPLWIKLHRGLLDDFEFHCLPVASKALAPMLWLLASEEEGGWIDADCRKLGFRLRMEPSDVDEALRPLVSAHFFEAEQMGGKALAEAEHVANDALAEPERSASPEKEREEEIEIETEERQIARSADADEITLAVDAYNIIGKELDWPLAQIMSEARRKKLAGRLRECGGLQGWQAAMEKAQASSFLRGAKGRDKAHESWVPALDFFLQQSSFTKLMEGKYDDRESKVEPTGFAAVLAGAKAALAERN